MATIRTAHDPGLTLGVAIGPRDPIEAQLRNKAEVLRAMQERVAIVQDVQTEHVLNRESLGVGRVNHILRVHGHDALRPGGALAAFDARTRVELDRLFPGLTEESHSQASLGPSVGGLGWRRASEIACPANLGALIMAEPKVKSMAASAAHAGLRPQDNSRSASLPRSAASRRPTSGAWTRPSAGRPWSSCRRRGRRQRNTGRA